MGCVTRKLNRDSGERKALFRDLVSAVITHGRIETTVAKAKETKKITDSLVDLALRGDVHARRQAARPPPGGPGAPAAAAGGCPAPAPAGATPRTWRSSSWCRKHHRDRAHAATR